MTRIQRILLGLVALVSFMAVPLVASAQTAAAQSAPAAQRIAIVDVARALNEVNEGVAAKTRLEREMNRRQQELDRRQREVETFAKDLEAQFNTLSDAQKQERMQTYQTRMVELQQLYANHQQELARAEAQATQQIAERLQAVIRTVATSDNFTLVLDRAAVLHSATGMDITDRVIRAYNERHR